MKATKQMFNRIMRTIGVCSFVTFFGFGHIIVCNEKVDNTPVITVPVQIMPSRTIEINVGNTYYSSLVTDVICNYEDNDDETGNSNFDNAIFGLQFIKDTNGFKIYYRYFTLNYLYNNDSYSLYNENTLSSQYFSSQYYDVSNNLEITISFDLVFTTSFDYAVGFYWTIYDVDRNLQYTNYLVDRDNVQFNYFSGEFVASLNEFYIMNSYSFTVPDFRGYQTGYTDGINYVLNHLEEYDLFTREQYLAYGQSQYNLGRYNSSQVLNVSDMIREIFRAPISMFTNAFNFVLPLPDGTTLNVGGILTFFLTIGIALTIVGLISKIGGH